MGSIYQRKRDGKWVGTIEVPNTDLNNKKRERVSVYADSEKEVKRLYNKLEEDIEKEDS